MKALVLILLAAIVISLGSGLFFLTRKDQGSAKMLTALKIRVALSIILIGFLLFAYWSGWLNG